MEESFYKLFTGLALADFWEFFLYILSQQRDMYHTLHGAIPNHYVCSFRLSSYTLTYPVLC